MAARAEIGRIHAELGRTRILDVVDTVTIGADWDVWIVVLNQCDAVHAVFVIGKNLRVALAACLRDMGTWLIRFLNIVRAVTIGANRRRLIARRSRLGMHAVQRLIIIGGVTFLTGLII